MREHLLSNLVTRISAYDPIDLLTHVAALQLMPENADRAIRLEAFAHTIASLRFQPGKPQIHANRLKQICSSEPLGSGQIAASEDPCANSFTEAFTFYGGSFVVFPGIVEEATFILKHLSEALFRGSVPFSPPFLKKAHDLLEAILLLSNEIARRAKLERGTEPVSAPGGSVCFPITQRYNQLKRAVSFSRSELTELFARKDLPFSAIYPFITHFGQVSLAHYQLGSGKLLTHPIVQHGEQFIIAIPGILLAAVRHQLICLALENGVADELAKHYNLAVWNTVVDSLGYLKHRQVSLSLPQPSAIPCFQDAFFHFDTDKLAYVMLVTDSLVSYDRKEAFGPWSLDTLEAKIAERLHSVVENALSLAHPPNEIFFLILFQGVGRVGGLASDAVPAWAPVLGMTAADLQTIALLEMGEPLSLWKYACAAERIRKSTAMASPSQLDEFHLYKTHQHSYYFSDEGPVDAISLVCQRRNKNSRSTPT